MSLSGGTKDSGVPETGSPTVVVHEQVGDDLAALQVETVEVRQPVEVQPPWGQDVVVHLLHLPEQAPEEVIGEAIEGALWILM